MMWPTPYPWWLSYLLVPAFWLADLLDVWKSRPRGRLLPAQGAESTLRPHAGWPSSDTTGSTSRNGRVICATD